MMSAGTAQEFTITKTPFRVVNATQTPDLRAFPLSMPGHSLQNLNRNRFYRPDLGRFLSVDPLRFLSDKEAYRYAKGSPAMYVDPTGLYWDWVGYAYTWPNQLLFAWYMTGNGAVFNLDQFGILDMVKGSTWAKNGTKKIQTELDAKAKAIAAALCPSCVSGIRSARYKHDSFWRYNFSHDPYLTALGSGGVDVYANCHLQANCDARSYSYNCSVKSILADVYTDPLELQGDFGTPFLMLGVWNSTTGGAGSF